MSSRNTDLATARNEAENGDIDQAYVIADKYLKENPNDVPFLTIMVYVMLRAEKPTVAYHLAKRVTDLEPTAAGAWMNLGMACGDLWIEKEAIRAYEKGLRYAVLDSQKTMLAVNLSSIHIDRGRFDEGEKYCREALKTDPANQKALANLGFCQLAQRKWQEGWKNYRNCLGSEWRPKTKYGDEPDWNGEPGKVVLSAEQGIGDVISFASMIPDALKRADIIVEVNKKLKNLFVRSFPEAKIYGTRESKPGDKEALWDEGDWKIDYSLAMGQCGELFRQKDSDFPGTPYLKADPDRTLMWKSLFASKGKPAIGIAWSGGITKTGAKYRQWDLEQLLPILQSVNAHWVCLQYKPAAKEIAEFKAKHPEIDIVEYPHATLTADYDDTAAIVAALDRVICMQTAVGHLAGALGVPCWTFIPTNSQWRYGGDGEDFLWAKSVRLIRQRERGRWDDVISDTAGELNALYAGVPTAAGEAARQGQLRGDGKAVRPAHKPSYRPARDKPRSGLRKRQKPKSNGHAEAFP